MTVRTPAVRLMLLALVTTVPALAFIAYDQTVERARARTQAVGDAIGIARVAAGRQASVFDGVQRLLLTLAHVPALRDRDPAACNALLASVLQDHRGYVNIWVSQPDGAPFCQAVPIAPGTSAAHRTYLERVLRSRAIAMSDFQVSQTTGKPDVVVAQPLLSADGRVERVLAAGVGVAELGDVVRAVGMERGWSVTVADRNGTIVARYPDAQTMIGQTLPPALSLARAQRAPADALIEAQSIDGAMKLYGLAPIRSPIDTGMYVALEVDPVTVFAPANALLRTHLWLLAIVAFIAIGGGLVAGQAFVVRPVEMLAMATSRIASGDFAARTQLARAAPGLRDLGSAIDRMATALESRERTRAEVDEQLQASERRYRLMFEENPHPMWVYDSDTLRFLEVNDAAVRLYGYTRNEFLARTILDIRPPGDAARVRATVAAVPGSRQYSGQWHHRLTSGELIDVEITSHAITFNNRPARLVLAQDITRRVQAERALREAEARMRFALDAARVGIWQADIRSEQTYWSPTCEVMHGLEPGTFGGTMADVIACIHPDDRARVKRQFDDALGERRTLALAYRTVAPDGTERHVSAKGQFVYDKEGRPERAAGIAIDVTEQVLLEEQLRQAQKMEAIGQLAGGIAHDFNNVLTAILGNAEMYLDAVAAHDPHRRTIEEIRTAARAAANLTHQLLAFSRRQMLTPKVLRLGESVTEVAPMLRRLLGASITLETTLADTRCVKADPGQVQQVLMNLTVNARDAMPQGGRLTIATGDVILDEAHVRRTPGVQPGRYATISVADTGHGMDAATQRRLFEPFFTTKPKGHGTGLGLATVHGIVRQSGGYVTAESEVGVGTTFTVYLPTTGEAAPRPEPASIEPAALTGGETILLVEDEAAVRDFVYRVLARYGYRVYAVADPQHAIEFASTFRDTIDIILSDVVLPGINGQVMASRIRAIHPTARVLFMSGYTDISVITGGELEPGSWFLKKPFTSDALGQRVRQALDAQIA